MKKLIYIFIILIILTTGCTISESTPTIAVEEYMSKYQNLESNIIEDLKKYNLDDNMDMNDEQRKDYTSLLQKQYQKLKYKIKDEKTENNYATVEVEIEVFDYRNSILESEKYIEANKKEFLKEDNSINQDKYIDYKLKEMKKVTDKKKYTLMFTLHKQKDKWIVDNLTERDMEKLHGLYQD